MDFWCGTQFIPQQVASNFSLTLFFTSYHEDVSPYVVTLGITCCIFSQTEVSGAEQSEGTNSKIPWSLLSLCGVLVHEVSHAKCSNFFWFMPGSCFSVSYYPGSTTHRNGGLLRVISAFSEDIFPQYSKAKIKVHTCRRRRPLSE